jgi:hypothetical protein
MLEMRVTLNIADVDRLISEEMQRRYPGTQITGWTLKSWNTSLVQVEDGTMTYPVHHHVRAEHAELPPLKG